MRRVAVVTGAARRLGAAIARHLGGQGYEVVVHYRRSQAEAEGVAAAIRAAGGAAWVAAADLTREAEAAALFEEVGRRCGRLHVLVNNVGTYQVKPVAELTPADWRYVVEGNLTATFHGCHFALPLLRAAAPGARIVNLGYASCGRIVARPRAAHYQAAKTGVLLYTQALAKALAPEGITANCLSPGHLENSVDLPEDVAAAIPAGRPATEADLLAALDYLLSEGAAYVTGQNLEVAGGFNL
ncbi:MAG: SDR family oxidoreductase [Nitrospirae bacterium]|nr:MAG: SDR family oxidoreductase [Nitrospirota bacterium]